MAAGLRLPWLLGRREKGGGKVRRGSGGAAEPRGPAGLSRTELPGAHSSLSQCSCRECGFGRAPALPSSLALGAATWRPRVRVEGGGPARPAWALRGVRSAGALGPPETPAGIGDIWGQYHGGG